MSLLGGIISGAMQGVGDAGQQITQQNAKLMDEQTLMQQRADLELQKQKAILQATEDIKNAPMTRLSASVQRFANQEIPVDAAPVDSLSADSAKKVGLQDGIQGDASTVNALVQQAQGTLSNPSATAEQKANAQGIIDQMANQAVAQSDINSAAVAGKTRKMTPKEAFDAAGKDAMINDIPAYAAYKGLAADKTIKVGDGETLLDANTLKPIISNNGKEERSHAHDLRIERMRMNLELLKDRDPQFIRELKAIYPEGSVEYNAAIKARINKEAGVVDSAIVDQNARAIAEGKQDPPNLNSRSTQNAAIMARVYEINPDFNKRLYVAAQKSANAFAIGPDGATVSSFSATADHLVMLKEAAAALKNGNVQMFNQLGNAYAKATGSAAPTNMSAISQLVAGEIVKAVTAGNGALGDREGLEKNLQSKLSPDQIAGTIDQYNGMIVAQINAKYQKYNSNIPAYVNNPELSDFARFLSPRVRALTGINPPEGKSTGWGTTTSPSASTPIPSPFSPKPAAKSFDLPPGFVLDK